MPQSFQVTLCTTACVPAVNRLFSGTSKDGANGVTACAPSSTIAWPTGAAGSRATTTSVQPASATGLVSSAGACACQVPPPLEATRLVTLA